MVFMTHNNKGRSGFAGKAAAFLAGAATTAAVGGYLLYGPHGARNRKKMEAWMDSAKAEILERMEQIGEVTEQQYHTIVDEVADQYADMRTIGTAKAKQFSQEFKRRYKEMREATRRAAEEAKQELEIEDEIERATR